MLHPGRDALRSVGRRLDAKKFAAKFPEPHLFARFLAKVAFGFSVACVGSGGITNPYIIPGILGQRRDIGRWVGNLDGLPVNDRSGLHAVTLRREGDELWAHVRLFAQFGAPEYLVIVGSLGETGACSYP